MDYRPFLLLVALSLGGCSTIGYYAQSIGGHLDLMGRSRPFDQLLDNPATPDSLRLRLQRVSEMRTFASDQLKLPDNASYRSYADLKRDAVVWSVVATPEFSMEPRNWCYPIIGCASYRGYFSREQAVNYANGLKEEGFDVAVQPVPAYSTLGWFDDPLPSTVIHWPEFRLAGLIFHELSHQRLYINGDSAFNEAFANTVQQVGMERWLSSDSKGIGLDEWQRSQKRGEAFIALLLESRQRLEELYARSLQDSEKRELKAAEFQRLIANYGALKQLWNGYTGYDHWFDRELNNARLASVATYERWVPVFKLLLQQAGGDMTAFYLACERLGALPEKQRHAKIERLLETTTNGNSGSRPAPG